MKWYWLKKNIYLSDEDLKNKMKESLSMEVSDASFSNVANYFSYKEYEFDFIDKKLRENDFIVTTIMEGYHLMLLHLNLKMDFINSF